MTPVTKQAWVNALRSGDYPQGQHCLQGNGGFCCLGVLAEVTGVDSRVNDEGTTEYLFNLDGDQIVAEEAVIPHDLQSTIIEDLDLQMRLTPGDILGAPYGNESLHSRLITMNDEGATFEQIADYIEGVANDSQ